MDYKCKTSLIVGFACTVCMCSACHLVAVQKHDTIVVWTQFDYVDQGISKGFLHEKCLN